MSSPYPPTDCTTVILLLPSIDNDWIVIGAPSWTQNSLSPEWTEIYLVGNALFIVIYLNYATYSRINHNLVPVCLFNVASATTTVDMLETNNSLLTFSLSFFKSRCQSRLRLWLLAWFDLCVAFLSRSVGLGYFYTTFWNLFLISSGFVLWYLYTLILAVSVSSFFW